MTPLKVNEIYGPTWQGEGVSAGRFCLFVRLALCNQTCKWCIAEDMQVLMADWSTKSIQDVLPDDIVMGVNRERKGGHLCYAPSRVSYVWNRGTRDCVSVGAGGRRVLVTPEHEFLVNTYREYWQSAQSLSRSRIAHITHVLPEGQIDQEYKRGWLAGYSDGDGNFHLFQGRWLRFKSTSIDPEILDRLENFAASFKIPLRHIIHQGGQFGGKNYTIPGLECTLSEVVQQFQSLLSNNGTTERFYAGYLAGIYDAEGGLSASKHYDYTDGLPRLSQSHRVNLPILNRIRKALEKLGYKYNEQVVKEKGMTIICIGQPGQFFAQCRPVCTRKYAQHLSIRTVPKQTIVVNQEHIRRPVYDLTTETGNFVVEGLTVHNCDTPFTWAYSETLAAKHNSGIVYNKDEEIHEMTTEEALVALTECWPIDEQPCLIVFSGGEPLMQQVALVPLLRELTNRACEIHIETAGTLAPIPELDYYVSQYNVSPKLANSGNLFDRRNKPAVIRRLCDTAKAYFKFVVADTSDLAEVDSIVARSDIPLYRVQIMPEGTDTGTILDTAYAIQDEVLKRGYGLTLRNHILIYGNKRGT